MDLRLIPDADPVVAARAWARTAARRPAGTLEGDRARVHLATLRFLRTGQGGRAGAVWRSALATAQVERDLDLEATCLLRLAMLHHLRGDLTDSRRCLDRAAGVFRDLGPGSAEEPFHRVRRGILAALEGDYVPAVGWLEAAAALARRAPPWIELLTEAAAAPWMAFLDPARMQTDPQDLAARLHRAGYHAWEVHARRTEVTVLLSEGRFAEASTVGHAAADIETNPAERARVLLTTAWGEREDGRDDLAAATFAEACRAAESVDARFLRTMALFGRAEAEPDRAATLLQDAIADAGSGPAWARLWASRPPVVVRVLDHRQILVDGRDVPFRSERAAELLFCVILAGPGGIHWADLAARMWPETVDPARAASNVTSHTTTARRQLGPEGWRLRRAGPTLWFEPSGVTVDLEEAGGHVPPGVALLPGWGDRPWVADLRRRRAGDEAPSDAVASR